MSYDKVSLLLPMNGANNGTTFTDYSPVMKTVTRNGSIVTVTASSKFYGSSVAFANNTQYLSIPTFTLGTSFTIEFWLRSVFASQANPFPHIFSFLNSGLFFRQASGTMTWRSYGGAMTHADVSGSSALSGSDYNHIALVNNAGQIAIAKDGVFGSWVTTANTFAGPFLLGRLDATSNNLTVGNVNDLRITSNLARYTANFTPPARLLGTISNTGVGAAKILDINGDPAVRKIFAVPRSYLGANGVGRIFTGESDINGEFEIQAPAGVDHSVVALADETDLRNDLVARVIPA